MGNGKEGGGMGNSPQPVPLGGFTPRHHLPEPRAGPCLGLPKSAPATLPTLSGCRMDLPLSLCKDLGMKISVHIEAHIYFYFITVPWLFQEIFLQDSHGASLEGTRVSLIGTVPSLPSCRWNGDQHPLQVLHTCSDTERLHIWTS